MKYSEYISSHTQEKKTISVLSLLGTNSAVFMFIYTGFVVFTGEIRQFQYKIRTHILILIVEVDIVENNAKETCRCQRSKGVRQKVLTCIFDTFWTIFRCSSSGLKTESYNCSNDVGNICCFIASKRTNGLQRNLRFDTMESRKSNVSS